MSGKKKIAVSEAKAGREPDGVSVYLIYGTDDLQVLREAQELVARLVPESQRDWGLEVIDGRHDTASEIARRIRDTTMAVQMPGFLGGTKVVWLRGLKAYEVPSSNDLEEAIDRLVEVIRAGFAPGVVLVITARKVDGRSALAKVCAERGEVKVFAVPEKEWEAEHYREEVAEREFRKAGLNPSREALEEFLARAGDEPMEIASEVEKISLFIAPRREVTPADVQAAMADTHKAVVWDLVDAFGERNLVNALGALRRLLEHGEEPVRVIALLESRLRELMFVKWCMQQRWMRSTASWPGFAWQIPRDAEERLSQLAKDPRATHPFVMKKLVEHAERYTVQELYRALYEILRAHERLFRSSLPALAVLQFMLIRVMSEKNNENVYPVGRTKAGTSG